MRRPSTPARREAQARYDQTRPTPVAVRLSVDDPQWLDPARQPGESRGRALKRLAKLGAEMSRIP